MTTDPADDRSRGLPRIGDAERQAAVDALADHYVDGRLDEAEFNKRMDAAMQARTSADLRPLFADLPPLGGFGPSTPSSHEQMVPAPPPYLPATPPPPAGVPATSASSRARTLKLVQTLVWPVAMVLWIFFGLNFWPMIGIAILTSIVVGKLLEDEKRKRKELPPGWDEPIDPLDPNGPRPPRL